MMLSKECLVNHPYNIMFVLRILLHNIFQILSFFVSEFVIHLSVSGNLYSEQRFSWQFMISALNYLGEWSLA